MPGTRKISPTHRRFKAGPKPKRPTHDANGNELPLTNLEKNALVIEDSSTAKPYQQYGEHATGRMFTGERLRIDLAALNRDPFRDTLAMFLGAHPSIKAVETMAIEDPHRWVNSIAMLARLAGYTDKLEITQNIYGRIAVMSDSELEEELTRLNNTIDVTPSSQTQTQDQTPVSEEQTQSNPVKSKKSFQDQDKDGAPLTRRTP